MDAFSGNLYVALLLKHLVIFLFLINTFSKKSEDIRFVYLTWLHLTYPKYKPESMHHIDKHWLITIFGACRGNTEYQSKHPLNMDRYSTVPHALHPGSQRGSGFVRPPLFVSLSHPPFLSLALPLALCVFGDRWPL